MNMLFRLLDRGELALTCPITTSAAQVYPASKIFALLVETAHGTRNQKSRAEALSEMAALIERLGLEQVSFFSCPFDSKVDKKN